MCLLQVGFVPWTTYSHRLLIHVSPPSGFCSLTCSFLRTVNSCVPFECFCCCCCFCLTYSFSQTVNSCAPSQWVFFAYLFIPTHCQSMCPLSVGFLVRPIHFHRVSIHVSPPSGFCCLTYSFPQTVSLCALSQCVFLFDLFIPTDCQFMCPLSVGFLV